MSYCPFCNCTIFLQCLGESKALTMSILKGGPGMLPKASGRGRRILLLVGEANTATEASANRTLAKACIDCYIPENETDESIGGQVQLPVNMNARWSTSEVSFGKRGSAFPLWVRGPKILKKCSSLSANSGVQEMY